MKERREEERGVEGRRGEGMSADWLSLGGCCMRQRRARARRWRRRRRRGGSGGGRTRFELTGETEELRNGFLILYSPSPNSSCLMRLVRREEKREKRERERGGGH